MENGDFGDSPSDLPPGLSEMFINSTDTLRSRELDQSIPTTWNDKPPLFYSGKPKRKSFLWRNEQPPPGTQGANDLDQEDPNLLKGVST